MSIVRVFFNPLDAKSEERFEVDDGLLIIDFLQREFPAGFSSPVRIFAGHEELDPDDWDYPIKEHEQITILVMPAEAGFWSYVVAEVLIPALIAAAVGLVINFIFKPKTPGGSDNGDESPIYSIGATKNLARLGAPVEAVYGQVNWPPSYAAAPYSFFSTNFVGANEMWVDELLCLGHGKFELLDVTVGNSSVFDLAPGSVKYWLFDSSQHLQTLGVIEQAVWESVENSEYPQRFYENMFTSPEVSDFIFQSTTTGLITGWLPISGNVISGDGGAYTSDRIENVPRTVSVSSGDIITLQNTDSNNITFEVSSVLRDPATPTTMTIYSRWNSPAFTDESPLNALAEYEINDGTDTARIAGPFRAQRLDQTVTFIWCDFIFPQGLYHRDGTDGDIKNASVLFTFVYQQIDPDTGDAIGAPVSRTDYFQARTLTPYRRSTVSPELTPGAYEVTVERTSEFDDERTVDMATWVGLRSAIQNDPTQVVYGDTTIMAIRMKATSGLGQAARERIRVTARRILEDDAVDSSSPPVVIKDIFLNPVYGLGREETELDIDQLDKLQADWIGPGGPRFNGAFDQRSTGFDSMESVAALAGARVVQDGGLLTVIPDQISDIRTALFSTANTIRDTLSILYTFDSYGEYNGMQIEYRDPSNWDASYVYYNPESDDEPSNPDTYTLFGCSDETYAAQYARYLWNVKARRRKEVTLQTELEGLIPKFGDRVGVSTPMPSWGQSGVFVREVNATTWIVDQDLDWTTDNVLIIRNEYGTGSTEYSVSQGTAANIVVFAVQPTETIAPADFREPSNYIFGVTGELVRDFMVTKVAPKTDTTLEITAQTYDELVYEGAPPHMRGETGYSCTAQFDFYSKQTGTMSYYSRAYAADSTGDNGSLTNFATGIGYDFDASNINAKTSSDTRNMDTCTPQDIMLYDGNFAVRSSHVPSNSSTYFGSGDNATFIANIYSDVASTDAQSGFIFGWDADSGGGPIDGFGFRYRILYNHRTGLVRYEQNNTTDGDQWIRGDVNTGLILDSDINTGFALLGVHVRRFSNAVEISCSINGSDWTDPAIMTTTASGLPISGLEGNVYSLDDDIGPVGARRYPSFGGIDETRASFSGGMIHQAFFLERPSNDYMKLAWNAFQQNLFPTG